MSQTSGVAVTATGLRLNDVEIESIQTCGTLVTPLHNITANDEGPYQCVTEILNSTLDRIDAGNLHILGKHDYIVQLSIIYMPHCPHHDGGGMLLLTFAGSLCPIITLGD